MNKAVIFCGGEINDYSYLRSRSFDNTYILCADSGLKHAMELNINPDAVIGDFDSWTGERPTNIEVEVYRPEKNMSDTHICIDRAIEHGCTEVELIGAIGGRLDHEFSHYCLLAYGLNNGVRIKITDEYNEIWMEDKPFCIYASEKRYVSFFPYGGEVEGFTLKGFKYPLDNVLLSCDSELTLSNETESDKAEVSFTSGKVLVMLCSDGRKISYEKA